MTNSIELLKTWMSKMPTPLKDIPLINLAIPGTHDSMSYGINRKAKVAPDAEPVVINLYKVLPCVVRRWAITQRLNVMQQLNYGIRYFDLRICLNRKDNNFYFVHGLFCEEITEPLRKIREYLDEYPQEFVIFDCQHFYNFSNGDYGRLEKILRKIFENKFFTPHDGLLNELTLYRAHTMKRQLLIIYRYAHVPNEFWPSDSWPTPWPNQIKVKKLKAYLNATLKYRSADAGYVSQCVLTPPVNYIIPRFYSSLRQKCASKVNKGLIEWIKLQRPGPFELNGNQPTSNVFIADFVEMNNFEFCRAVVQLNDKLLVELAMENSSLNDSICANNDNENNDDESSERKDE